MTTVTGTIVTAAGDHPRGASVTVTLVDQAGRATPGFAGTSEVLGVVSVPVAADGSWSVSLTPTASITSPRGPTLYQVTERVQTGVSASYYISVPATGPAWVGSLRVTLPGAADELLVGYLPLTGGTMSGPIVLPDASPAASEAYVASHGGGGGGGGSGHTPQLYSGSAAPSTLHVDGDLYLRTSNGDLYQQQASAWVLKGNLQGPQGAAGATGATGATGSAGSPGATTFAFSRGGTLTVANGTHRMFNDTGSPLTIKAVRASVGTAPTGSSVVVDINKNGVTIFTTQSARPAIAISANTSGRVTAMDVVTIADGDYFTVDIDQIGSGVAGADLTVQIVC